MAYREIPEEEYTPKNFLKFKDVFGKVGDTFLGIFEGEAEGNYGTDYSFKTNIGPATITIKGALKKQLEKAQLTKGDLVAIQYAKDVDVGKANPMRSFKVKVDSDFKGPPPKNGPNVAIRSRDEFSSSESSAPF